MSGKLQFHTPKLMVHAGPCCICECGLDTGKTDAKGRAVHTGDIVSLYLVDDTTDEWHLEQPLTAVVADQFTTYSNGAVNLNDAPRTFFTMGIKSEGISSPKWQVIIAKKFNDVVAGEHWPAYGFSYRQNKAAEEALRLAGGDQS